jgi:hypothetical protein
MPKKRSGMDALAEAIKKTSMLKNVSKVIKKSIKQEKHITKVTFDEFNDASWSPHKQFMENGAT